MFGLLFPVFSILVEARIQRQGFSLPDLLAVFVQQPLLWVIATAPFFLGALAAFAGSRRDRLELAMQQSNRQLVELRAAQLKSEIEEQERRSLEKQLLQSQKMEVVGSLAAGVAHDFNNLLSAIIGNADLLTDMAEPDTDLHDGLGEIQSAGLRASALTGKLLSFSRQEVRREKTFALNPLIREEVKMLDRLVSENIDLKISLGEDVGNVRGDASEIGQILLNLVVNARDAINDCRTTGTIRITSSVRDLGEHELPTPHLAPGRYLEIAASDNGKGMDDTVKAKIFNPFFTTKVAGQGTGLGLSTVHGIVSRCGGFIEVDSQLGKGTTFRVCLPEEAGEVEAVTLESVHADLRGTERILLVEDEDSIRHLTAKVLRSKGYVVVEAGHPKTALDIAMQGDTDRFELLITDVVMPAMNGTQVAGKIKEMTPDVACLFLSGYSQDELVGNHRILLEGTHFLQKPYRVNELLTIVRNVLDARDRTMRQEGLRASKTASLTSSR